jgi:methylenetetrahydrofolate dehydrogenase (NADP+)/methenyltetrahydrofolate cyclohydrolase
MKLLNGKKLAEEILENLKKKIKKRKLKLRLAVIQVGENPISQIFINQKKKACKKVGIDFKLHQFGGKIKARQLKKEIAKITNNPQNSGIIIQLPLPKNLDTQEVLSTIPQKKDIDVLSEASLGKFYTSTLPILPPTVKGISYLLAKYRIKIKGKHVVVVGVGRLVGNPLALWLLHEKATVSTVTEFTKEVSFFTKKADILVTGVGKPNLIRSNMIKEGVIVIDAGCSIWKGKLVGDVDFKNVSKKTSYITPSPGGVGPMTVACLLENLVEL